MARHAKIDRFSDWEALLSEWLGTAQGRPYAWGEHDCMLHVADAVAALTGVDPLASSRGRYSTRAGAYRQLRRLRAETCVALLDRWFTRIPPGFAQRGDVAAVEDAPGVVLGGHARMLLHDGAVMAPRRTWTAAWAVGRRTEG